MELVATSGCKLSKQLEQAMKSKTIIVLLALTFVTVGPSTSSAGAVQADPSIQTFWAKFKLAVTRGDKQSVASMSQVPIEMPYGFPAIKTRAQFLKRYREVFSVQANAIKCFANATPRVEDKNGFTIGCQDKGGNENVVYGFAKKRGVWKL